ncbi:hypothetical protein I7V28_19045 [Lelliottia amnigena]|uniref:hypothetical protein n=1 Tax=Lelliottia TaxID=1330545 RepID=UPI00192CC52E|nr:MULTISPECIES: hypothetical protein [Lelliottia]MBL5885607.1 hypothetical protein [Lelliottia aquatilis]MBL5923179.1 hypothetical protein [Lelliottia amnigena]MBL5932095.1 hypothetical protein [Lelliottia amnigena]
MKDITMTKEQLVESMKAQYQRVNKLGSYQRACLAFVERHGTIFLNQCSNRDRKTYDRLVELGFLVLSHGETRTDYLGYRLPHKTLTKEVPPKGNI